MEKRKYLIIFCITEVRVYSKQKGIKSYTSINELSDSFKEKTQFRFYLPFIPIAGDEINLYDLDLLDCDLKSIKRNVFAKGVSETSAIVNNRFTFSDLKYPDAIYVNAYFDIPIEGNWLLNILLRENFHKNTNYENEFKMYEKI